MTASGLPAVLIRLVISGELGASWRPPLPEDAACFDEIADIAVSIEEFRGNPLVTSFGVEAIVAAMTGLPTFAGPRAGFDVTESETLRWSFGRFEKFSLRNMEDQQAWTKGREMAFLELKINRRKQQSPRTAMTSPG